MKSRLGSVLAGLAIVAVMGGGAHAITITFDVGHTFSSGHTVLNPVAVPITLAADGLGGFTAQDTSVTLVDGTVVAIEGIRIESDPVLTFGVNVTTVGSTPLSVAVAVFSPILDGMGNPTALHGLVNLESSLSGSFADGSSVPRNGGTVAPNVAPTISQYDLNGTVLDGTGGTPNMNVGATHVYNTGAFSQSFDFGTATGQFDCDSFGAGGCTFFSTGIAFLGTPGSGQVQGDNFGFSSAFSVEPAPVPEPASLLLLGSGLIGTILGRKLRKRA